MHVQHSESGKLAILISVALFVAISFGYPALLLASKPASKQETYVAGWQDGCTSGVSAYAPLRSLLSDEPFVRKAEDTPKPALDPYRNAWNEGYTSCRFNQSAWYELIGMFIIVLALFCTRYRRENTI